MRVLMIPVAAAMPATKAGIADNKIGSSLAALRETPVTWAYDWSPWAGADAAAYIDAGVQYVPMVWGHPGLPDLGNMPDAEILFGFNEPNMLEQSNLDPETAAQLWPQVEARAASHGVQTLVGPSLNWGDGNVKNPAEWYRRFLSSCHDCRIDAIGIHVYNCQLRNMKDRIDMFREFDKPLWITEFACADNPTTCGKGWSCQCNYMREVIPFLESEDIVAGYAWFSKNSAYTGESSLIKHGQLTELGKCYTDTIAAAHADTLTSSTTSTGPRTSRQSTTIPSTGTPASSGWPPCHGPGACCNPYTFPAQLCPSGQQCQECGGGRACQCPSKADVFV